MNGGLSIDLSPDALEALARRVAELLAERQPSENGTSEWLRGADAIGAHIGAPRSRVYALAACKPPRLPVHKEGSALIAKRSDLDAWIASGGGRRP